MHGRAGGMMWPPRWRTAVALGCTLLAFAAHCVAAHAAATVGMPFAGKWAYNVNVDPPYTDSNSSHPSVHHRFYGDWATDLYAASGTPVILQVSAQGTLSFAWLSFADGSCGQRTVIAVYVDGTPVGSVYYEHLSSAVKSGPAPTNGMVVGYVHDWGGCNPGPHIHIELKNTSNYSCWTDHGHPGTFLAQGEPLGVLGSSNTGPQQACAGTPPPPPDGDGDGVPDSDDHCPTVRGDPGQLGCPAPNGVPIDVNGDGKIDLVHRWSQGVNTWISNGDGGYSIRGQQAQAGYGYTDGQWPASIYSLALIRRPPPPPIQPPTGTTPAPSPTTGTSGTPTALTTNPTESTSTTRTPRPAQCLVPRLHNKTLAQANRALRRAHCRLGKVRRQRRARRGHRARVRHQSARPGRPHATNFKVDVTLR
jgi:hypothetical protein